MYCKAIVQEDKEGICFQFESGGILKSAGENKKKERKKKGNAKPFMPLCAL
jgi:hypothetical protein